jgi:hypothetical protein
MTNKEFVPIRGFEGLYSVNQNGDVRSERSGKLFAKCKNSHGYATVILRKDGISHSKKVHRLVAETFLQNPEKKRDVNHIDGDKSNNEVSNLEWATSKENRRHALKTGLAPSKKIRVIETGKEYLSANECAKDINGSYADIYHCLNGERKTHKGYHYEYVE